MIDTTERFLKEIGDRIGATLVEEIRLFPPIRQGGTESAVAIVATTAYPDPWHTVYSARYRHTLKGADREHNDAMNVPRILDYFPRLNKSRRGNQKRIDLIATGGAMCSYLIVE